MKISAIGLAELEGILKYPGELLEERCICPVDTYSEQSRGSYWAFATLKTTEGQYCLQERVALIETIDGVSRLYGI